MLWSAWMTPISRPVSCCGKKPFGTIDVQIDVEARSSTSSTSIIERAVPQRPVERLRRSRAARASNARSAARVEAAVLRARFAGRSRRAHIIGVVVSETTSEIEDRRPTA